MPVAGLKLILPALNLQTVTDSAGAYAFDNLPTGTFAISSDDARYLTLTQQGISVPGQTTTLDFTLTPNGEISVYVYGLNDDYLYGEDDEQPLAGAVVSLGANLPSGVTDANGYCSFTGLATGSYTVTASATGYLTTTQTVICTQGQVSNCSVGLEPVGFVPGGASAILKGVVYDHSTGAVLPGATVFITPGLQSVQSAADGTFTLVLYHIPAGSYTLSASAPGYYTGTSAPFDISGFAHDTFYVALAPNTGYQPGANLTGQVTAGDTGLPLANAQVSLDQQLTVTTDLSGTYTLSGDMGAHVLTACADWYLPASQSVTLAFGDNTLNLTLAPYQNIQVSLSTPSNGASVPVPAVTVTVNPDALSQVTDANGNCGFRVTQAGYYTVTTQSPDYKTVSGTVSVTATNIASVDCSMVPCGAVAGQVTDAGSGAPLAGVAIALGSFTATTDAKGCYNLVEVDTGDYPCVTATLANYSTGAQPVTVLQGQTSTLNFALSACGTLSGLVTDTSQHPVSGITLSFAGQTAVSGSDGSYTFAQAPTGPNTLAINDPAYLPYTQSVTITAGSSVTQNVTLIPVGAGRAMLAGTVTDAGTGAALPGVLISDGVHQATTDAHGAYTLVNLPVQSALTITVSLAGYATLATPVTTGAANSTATLNVALAALPPTGGTLAGRVVDATTQAALPGVTVSVAGLTATTDASGRFTLANLPAGAAAVALSKTSYQSQTLPVTIVANGTLTLDNPPISLQGLGSIAGTVTNPAGQPIAGAVVNATAQQTTTNAQGQYTLSGLLPGAYTLGITAAGYAGATQSTTVVTAQTATVNVVLTSAVATITVQVSGGDTNLPLAQAAVTLTSADQTVNQTLQTNTNGACTFTGLPANTYTATVSAAGYVTQQSPSQAVQVNAAYQLTLTLTRLGRITGTVTDALSNAPLAGATVSTGAVSTTTDSQGTTPCSIYPPARPPSPPRQPATLAPPAASPSPMAAPARSAWLSPRPAGSPAASPPGALRWPAPPSASAPPPPPPRRMARIAWRRSLSAPTASAPSPWAT